MLWDTFRGTAIDLSVALAESFQRFTAPKQPSILEAELAAGIGTEVSFQDGVPTVKTLPTQKLEGKVKAKSASAA
jgi:hypothetical protein